MSVKTKGQSKSKNYLEVKSFPAGHFRKQKTKNCADLVSIRFTLCLSFLFCLTRISEEETKVQKQAIKSETGRNDSEVREDEF